MAIIGVLALCFSSFAATDAVYELDGLATSGSTIVGSISTSTGYDTLAASDSSGVLLSNWIPKKGFDYILVVGTITGTGSDSVALQIVVDCKDANGNVIYRATPDSITTGAGGAFNLDIGTIDAAGGAGVAVGHKYDVKLKTYTGAGTQAILNRLYVYRARPVSIGRDWSVGR
jgi:hypothetical protein